MALIQDIIGYKSRFGLPGDADRVHVHLGDVGLTLSETLGANILAEAAQLRHGLNGTRAAIFGIDTVSWEPPDESIVQLLGTWDYVLPHFDPQSIDVAVSHISVGYYGKTPAPRFEDMAEYTYSVIQLVYSKLKIGGVFRMTLDKKPLFMIQDFANRKNLSYAISPLAAEDVSYYSRDDEGCRVMTIRRQNPRDIALDSNDLAGSYRLSNLNGKINRIH